jgi:hypothetical protein
MLQSAITVAEARSCSCVPASTKWPVHGPAEAHHGGEPRERVPEETDAAIASDHRHEQRAGGVHETDEEEAA